METFSVNLNTVRLSKSDRFKKFLMLFVICGSIYFAVECLWPTRFWTVSSRGKLVQAVLWGLMMSACSAYWGLPGVATEYQIAVDENEIRSQNFKRMGRIYSRTISKAEVKTLFERRYGLLVSRHGLLETLMWGGVWIPKQLAEYEYLKRVVESWRAATWLDEL